MGLAALVLGALSAIPSAASAAQESLPAAAGQQALGVRAAPGGITARVCAAGACAADGGQALEVPAAVTPLLVGARVRRVVLADGRHLARIEADRGGTGETWVMLVAAPIAGKGSAPIVLWSGWTGVARGEHGEERAHAVIEEPAGKGSRVVVGQRREDVTICGRKTVVAAREVDPATMTLARGASVQNLSAEERGKATKIAATRREGDTPAPAFRLLRPTAASSAAGKRFTEIADGDPATSWSENREGVGRGEFVSFSSASEVGITGFGLSIKPKAPAAASPPAPAGEGGAAPRVLFVATPDRLFEVTLPEDAWKSEASGYEVKLPQELRTSCVAIVLEDAYAPRGAKNPQVTIAELSVRTAFDGQSPAALVGALAGGDDRAKAAAALLGRSGPQAIEATIQGYEKLDIAGRQLAAGVIDAAPCDVHAAFFAERLAASAIAYAEAKKRRDPAASEDPEAHHARDRLRRCGRKAAPALAKLVREGEDPVKLAAARELALAAPAEAVPALLDTIPRVRDPLRRELRAALAQAAQSERAVDALAAEVRADKLRARPEIAQIDLLRALGPALIRVPGAGDAFQLLAAASNAPFRTRYLLLSPAAELARAGDAKAEASLRAALRKDADRHIRARAAEVAARVPALAADLLAAIADPEVRVREAAVAALGHQAAAGAKVPPGTPAALAKRLASDPWTFVRFGAARALSAMPPAPAVDAALATALKDLSPEVRSHALDALGAHRATAHREAVRDRAEDTEEHTEVRARALLALAGMCDRSALDLWTKLALRAKAPLGERDHRLGTASLAALGQVHPADLEKRLAPLLDKDTPRGVREMAKASIEATGQCR
jgi:hypothetical protein